MLSTGIDKANANRRANNSGRVTKIVDANRKSNKPSTGTDTIDIDIDKKIDPGI